LSVAATATLSCTPAWCLSIALAGPDGVPTLYELVTPDGSRRLRVGGPRVSAAIPDVALLDRFEPVRLAGTAGGIGAQLALYDIRAARLVVVADAVGQVAGRQGVLWWSTGGPQTISWHSLDLTTLTR